MSKDDRWWESLNPEANWDMLYEQYPDVDWGTFFSELPPKILDQEEE